MNLINYNIDGVNAGGLFTVTTIPSSCFPVDISTFNSSLCAVIGLSDSSGVLQIYRPASNLNPFTSFEPGRGYVILAHTPFTLTLTAVSFADECNTVAVQMSSDIQNSDNDIQCLKTDVSIPQLSSFIDDDIVAAYSYYPRGWSDFNIFCTFDENQGFQWNLQPGGGPYLKNYVQFKSQFFPYIGCPTSVEYGGECIYSPVVNLTSWNPVLSSAKATVRSLDDEPGWRDMDRWHKVETDSDSILEAAYKYSSCLGKNSFPSLSGIRIAYCNRATLVTDPFVDRTKYDSGGPLIVRVFEASPTGAPDLTWKRIGQPIDMQQPGFIGTKNAYLALGGGTLSLVVAGQGEVRVYQLIADQWIQKGATITKPNDLIMSVDVSEDGDFVFISKGANNVTEIGYECYQWNSVSSNWVQLGQTISFPYTYALIQDTFEEQLPSGVNCGFYEYKRHMSVSDHFVSVTGVANLAVAPSIAVISALGEYQIYAFDPTSNTWVQRGQTISIAPGPFRTFLDMGYGETLVVPISEYEVQCYKFDQTSNQWLPHGGPISGGDEKIYDAALASRGIVVGSQKNTATGNIVTPADRSVSLKWRDWDPVNDDWGTEEIIYQQQGSTVREANTGKIHAHTWDDVVVSRGIMSSSALSNAASVCQPLTDFKLLKRTN